MLKYQNHSFKKIIPIISLFLTVMFISSNLPNAKNILINDIALESSTIQQIIDSSDEGDHVFIQNGSYSESIWINKSITIQGESKGNSILSSTNQTTISINADNVTLFNFTIANSKTAINLYSSNCTIYNITFLENDAAINISELTQKNLIYQNNFIDNQINAVDHSNTTSWHKNSIGNYWDDYTGSDADNDGIGDSPYVISENASDPFPLMDPINLQPTADFYSAPASPTTQTIISFNDLSTDKDGTLVSWSWDFGDNTSSYLQHPTHQYDDDGTYKITLMVTDNLGLTDSQTYNLIVQNVPPEPSFTFHPEVPLDIQQVEFNDTSSDLDGTIVNHTWIINDTIIDNTKLLQYTFPDDGTYQITLEVTDDDGGISSSTRLITVLNVAPTAGFTYATENNNLTKDTPINFKDTSNDVDGSITSYTWDFGDGSSSTERHPSHSFSEDGRYKITLTVVDNDGVSDSFGKQIQIGQTENPDGFLTALSLFDIVMVVIIFAAVIAVVIVSKKFS